jgi:uncharacterized repeat protein (TIGR03803 family)
MLRKDRYAACAKALIAAAMALVLASSAWAGSKYKVLHAFTGGNDGGGLYSGLLLDRHGNVYGTTVAGGAKGKGGTAFKLRPLANGKWAEAVLYNFCSQFNCTDGGGSVAGLIFDAAGNLYGTTESGGAHVYGTVFELSPGSDGWKETVLHSFGFNKYGCCPQASLVMDDAGNLFGTASVAFELSPGADGWKETVLHDFTGQNGDGSGAYAGLIVDAAGNLYGVTLHGGGGGCGGGCGTAYELQPTADGGWKEHILHDFDTGGDTMAFPDGPLLIDGTDDLYGTTSVGGATGNGTVYRLTPQSDGHWKATVLHSFTGGANGIEPGGGVVMDKAGNLYGTTIAGGSPNCECGLVYKLSPGIGGKWNFKVLHTFVGIDGAQPAANLTLDDKGNLYGTTITGGAGGYGVAFELTP